MIKEEPLYNITSIIVYVCAYHIIVYYTLYTVLYCILLLYTICNVMFNVCFKVKEPPSNGRKV